MGGAGFRADPALTLLATMALGAALLLVPAVQWPAAQSTATVAQPTITVRPFPTGEVQSIVFLAAATHPDDVPVASGSEAPAPEPAAEPPEPAETAEPPEPPEATEGPIAPTATPTPNRRPLPRRDYAVPVTRIVGGWPFGP